VSTFFGQVPTQTVAIIAANAIATPMTADLIATLSPLIPALRRYARSLMRNRWDADDLVQDCLERAISRWHQRRGDDRHDGNTRAWLLAILHNLAMTRLARAARQPPTVAIDAETDHIMDRSSPPDPLERRDILAALARLPDEQRAVLLLVAVEDLSYAEAARVLDVPLGTVMSRLSRARDRLHALLFDNAVDTPNTPRAKLRIVKSC